MIAIAATSISSTAKDNDKIILSTSKSSSSLYCIDVLKIKQDYEFYRNIAAKFTSQTANFPLLQTQVK